MLASLPMFKLIVAMLSVLVIAYAADLPSKKYLNLAAIKTMVAAAEAEAERQHVSVTICIVDENGNLMFLERGDGISVNEIDEAIAQAGLEALLKR